MPSTSDWWPVAYEAGRSCLCLAAISRHQHRCPIAWIERPVERMYPAGWKLKRPNIVTGRSVGTRGRLSRANMRALSKPALQAQSRIRRIVAVSSASNAAGSQLPSTSNLPGSQLCLPFKHSRIFAVFSVLNVPGSSLCPPPRIP